jgi:YidC/Oxa1 family membrane protein insertase
MEKRVIQAVLLSLAVLFVYQSFLVPRRDMVRDPETVAPPSPTAPTAPSGSPQTLSEAVSPTPDAAAPPGDAEPAEPIVAATADERIVVTTPQVRAVFSTRGGVLLSWTLIGYEGSDGTPIDLVPPGLDLPVRPAFALSTLDPALSDRLAQALFKPSATSLDLAAGDERSLTFEYRDASGLAATKIFSFERDGQPFLLGLVAHVEQAGRPVNFTIHSGPGLGDIDRANSSGGFLFGTYYQGPQGITYHDDVSRLAPDSFAAQRVFEAPFHYAGMDDHYFLGAALLERQTRVEYSTYALPTPTGPKPLVAYSLTFPEPPSEVKFYLGPKDFDYLIRADQQLVRTIHFGWFAWLVVPLLKALKWINGFVGNYGWSIIILTFLINVVIFPLRHKSVASMRKMQQLQPRVKAIQERYAGLKATDPAKQKMNQEMMELYRSAGVNPASGCVPMLLTMPVLFAFYSLLAVAIELRGAPFALWIQDLSVHDPLYITPVIMGASMLWQQWITPTTGMDPAQQRIMMFMPLMFMVFFLWAPSGLVLYWLVSNLLTIGQQYITNRIVGPPPTPAVAAAAAPKPAGPKPAAPRRKVKA